MATFKPSATAQTVEPDRPPRSNWRRRWAILSGVVPAPLRIALVVGLLAWGLILGRGSLWIDIGANDALDTLYMGDDSGNFFAAENRPTSPVFPDADTTYRWAGTSPVLKIPWPLDAVPLKLQVRMTAPRPGLAAETVSTEVHSHGRLEWSEQDLGSVPVTGVYAGNYYDFKLPPHLRPNLAAYEIDFEADNSFKPVEDDKRQLSLLFFGVRLEPDYAAFGWRGWLASLELPALLAVISFCCWGIGRNLWPTGRTALVGESIAGGLLLISLVIWPLAAGPVYAPWGVILPFGWLLLGLAELFRKRASRLPAVFVYTATLFPLLPLTRFAFGRLYLYSLNPGTVIISVYVGALSYVGAMYINGGRGRSLLFEKAFSQAMLGAATVVFLFNHLNVFQTNLYRGVDFKTYYEALQRFQNGGPLYRLSEAGGIAGGILQLPPGFASLTWPFVQLFGSNTSLALLVWRVASEFLLIPCILILVRVFGEREEVKPAIWFVALNFEAIAENLGYGQYNILILLALSLMALWVKEGRNGLAGLSLAATFGLNFYLLLVAVYFGIQSRLKGLVGLGLGLLVWLGLIAATVGLSALGTYLWAGLFEFRVTPDVGNQSLWGFWSRLSVSQAGPDFKGEVAIWVTVAGWLSVAGLIGATGWLLWHARSGDTSLVRLLKLSLLLWLILIIPGLVRFSDDLIALIAILALLVELARPAPEARPRWQVTLFALAFATLAFGGRTDFFDDSTVGLGLLGSSYHFLAVLGLWALSLSLLARHQNENVQTQQTEKLN